MISRTGIHAIRALAHLAGLPQGTFAGAAALAREINAPSNYLGKLLQTLGRAGLVDSRKGLGGGFRLVRDPREITLLDVLGPIENVGKWEGCFLGLPECSDEEPCPIHEDWKKLRDEYLSMLGRTTISEIVAGYRARGVDLGTRPGGTKP